jgi:hypothetical protein
MGGHGGVTASGATEETDPGLDGGGVGGGVGAGGGEVRGGGGVGGGGLPGQG